MVFTGLCVKGRWKMTEYLADTVLSFIVCIGILVTILTMLIIYGLAYSNGEDNLIQKLCTQQQYDFCEVIEQKPEYKLKEFF